jgi:hypothetical protein
VVICCALLNEHDVMPIDPGVNSGLHPNEPPVLCVNIRTTGFVSEREVNILFFDS